MTHLPVVQTGPAREETPWIGPNGERMARLELHLTYTCPERCVFCSEEHRMQAYRRYPVTWARVATVLRMHASRGVKSVHLTGGEPTIFPDFVDVLRLAKKLGMRTSVGTIGTRLSDPEFAQAALPHLDEALFSLHAPNAALHDELAGRAGSFDQVVAAIETALRLRPDFGAYVNTVVTRKNLEALGDTVALADRLGAKLIVISNVTPEGNGLDRYTELAAPLAELARVLPTVPARAPRAILRFFGTPMCVLGEHGMLSNDLHWDPRVTVEWQTLPGKVTFDGIYSWTPDRKRVHVDACRRCELNQVCMGVFDRYAELFPTDALRPREAP
ncbi:MAG: radical SAM protein [Myxococcales bacterium]|nr:radical SAM protein [Myxococcales bacterium]